ncbi:hypothetical protein [uncultured Vagococcus sp.]|uniref:hypothetical protein n=1 Tax=uncultured Vagococcus sp. TaxID=189676 RepID=UPI0028D41132|nr:hypothetical protein [uncultured Vagococcus sp.]
MLNLNLILPFFSILWGCLFYYFPKTIWNNCFVLLHRQDAAYLYQSNKFIGKAMVISSLFFLVLSLLPSISLFTIFIPWLLANALIIPFYFELTWRFNKTRSHSETEGN